MMLHLARHGQSAANARDVVQGDAIDEGLTPEGARQAEALARSLARARLDAVYASPLRRATQTAAIVAIAIAAPKPRPVAAFREVSWGRWMGAPRAQAREDIERVLLAWRAGEREARAEGGESEREAWARAGPALAALARNHAHGSILVVAHRGINEVILHRLTGARVLQANAEVTSVEVSLPLSAVDGVEPR